MEYRPYKERMMDECTFKPRIIAADLSAAGTISAARAPTAEEKKQVVKGYDRTVQRYRTVAEEKKKLQEKMDK